MPLESSSGNNFTNGMLVTSQNIPLFLESSLGKQKGSEIYRVPGARYTYGDKRTLVLDMV